MKTLLLEISLRSWFCQAQPVAREGLPGCRGDQDTAVETELSVGFKVQSQGPGGEADSQDLCLPA